MSGNRAYVRARLSQLDTRLDAFMADVAQGYEVQRQALADDHAEALARTRQELERLATPPAPPVQPVEAPEPAEQPLTAEDVKAMSWSDYAAYRRTHGIERPDAGLFGSPLLNHPTQNGQTA